MSDYTDFLNRRAQSNRGDGFAPVVMPDHLFGFQQELVEWAVRAGRDAIFADCGLGKTPMQLAWADNVRRHTGRPVLIVTPLAVSFQTEHEAAKFGTDAAVSRDGKVRADVTITNYERLEHFNPDDFGGVVCDESSAIKAFDGQRRAIVTEFLRTHRYRLLCTATAAPNDYTELGTSSEALGYLGSGGSKATPRNRSGGGCRPGPGRSAGPPTSATATTGSTYPTSSTDSTSSTCHPTKTATPCSPSPPSGCRRSAANCGAPSSSAAKSPRRPSPTPSRRSPGATSTTKAGPSPA
jgi:hypothetical protein